MEEKRSGLRMRVLKAGKIAFGGSTIDCTIRNMSKSGALLEVESPLGVPHRFTVIIPADQTSRPCRRIWVSERRIGVLFDRMDDSSPVERGGNVS